ncbi:DUF6443 domain-containing protein [Aquimarina sp. MMG016]|uniref:DUF6443 domain-containing protein n=1 Tax=Aquimarina sp. MMG016 TaxID=2822690 RepID=UPI001B3A65F8|nr:DUF6443 domain-containing protein [Aquimarina sp. MMG016]MBQ4820848.1 RHS repeat-associated core domain-containing protein [Aquimarina sp. MMG016]
MKKIIYILAFCIYNAVVFGQTQTENYVETTVYQREIKVSPDDYQDFSINSGISDFLYDGSGGGGYSISMTNNVLQVSFSGGWSTGKLKTGVVKTLPISPPLQSDLELGEIITNGQPSGFKLKIRRDKLIVYSKYFVGGIATHNQRTIPGNQSYGSNYISLNGLVGICPGGSRFGEGYLQINGSTITLHVGFNYNFSTRSDCKPYSGFITSLSGSSIPDMELGNLRSAAGEETVYKARIWNNILEFYTDETIPTYPTSGGISYTNDFNIDEKDEISTIAYYDGLGRPKQSIAIRAGGQSQDIISHTEYDAYGRQNKEFLPYAKPTTQGDIVPNPLAELTSFYKTLKYEDTDNPYSESIYEPSPLNRVTEQGAPGNDWKADSLVDNDHTIKFDWRTNTDTDEVVGFKVNYVNGDTEKPSLIKNDFYTTGQLYVTITKDENWSPNQQNLNDRTTKEFKDSEGQVILKRAYSNNEAHDTYYVYDDFGNLTYVIPPKVILSATDGVSPEELAELCYQYKYDYRNRLVEKKIPGKGWEHIIYNKLDQPVMTQDSVQRSKSPVKELLVTKYDAFGRVAYTGLVKNNSTRTQLQASADTGAYTQYVTKEKDPSMIGGTTIYYSNDAIPTGINDIYTINYYDNYTFDHNVTNPGTVLGQTVTDNVQGLVTGSKVRVLETSDWITTVTYYDQKARPIYIHSTNEYLNTTDIVETQYNFVGNVLKTRSSHQKGSNPEIVTIDNYTYDHMNRLLAHRQCVGDSSLSVDCGGVNTSIEDALEFPAPVTETTAAIANKTIFLREGFHFNATPGAVFSANINEPDGELIVTNTYDELGQLVSKETGGGLQTIDYSYNIRGWLTQINDPGNLGNDLFAFGINYNNPTHGATALFNGNISETEWKTVNDNQQRWYKYSYDALNRITDAVSNNRRYDLFDVSYDKNGNLLFLGRDGYQGNNLYSGMDGLHYFYDTGNKLLQVADQGNPDYGFIDGTNTNDDYVYDANGNMTIDRNKGITGISYNYLNLPTSVSVNNTAPANDANGNIQYIYDATGAKLKKIATEGSSLTTTEYAGNYVYKNGQLQFFNTPEGYVEPDGNTWKYVYQYKDHLGNIRLSYADNDNDGKIDVVRNATDVDGDGDNAMEIREEKNYYPFGLTHKGYNDTQRGTPHNYGYNGKEEQNELRLDWIDYGARNYDPTLGRWMNIDPLAEKYSTFSSYVYVANSPVLALDPDGREIRWASYKEVKNDKELSKQFSSRKEYRQARRALKKEFRKLRKSSNTAKQVLIDLDADSDVHTIFATKGSSGTTKENTEGGTTIKIGVGLDGGNDFQEGASSREANTLATSAHELGHAWRFMNEFDKTITEELDVLKENVPLMNMINNEKEKSERGASHIENIIRGELISNGVQNLNIRSIYSGIRFTKKPPGSFIKHSLGSAHYSLLGDKYNKEGYLNNSYNLKNIKK